MEFQSNALLPHLTVAENIMFGMPVRRTPAAERESRLTRVADLLGLEPLLARKPSQLSGGQQQRVALGRAIIAEAPVCLMDEPLSNLDAQLRAEMRLEIRALQRKLGMTMVYVTHDQVEAMSMADRVVLLRGGRIEQNGMPVDLYERPANTFVARFIGTPPMNLLDLAPARGGAVIAGTDGPVVLDGAHANGRLGIRPEHIQLAFESGVRGGVDNVEYLGGDSLVACRVGGQAVAVRVGGGVGLRAGDAVWLRFAKGAGHFFDERGVRADVEPRTIAPTMIA
jgi:sn-glycerol 3-phosphate transport system ATP-binding protein